MASTDQLVTTRQPLSVVILAKNEARQIADCIRSVAWADEILVVDDESTDDTAAIATSLGARIVHRKMDIEGRHRNWAHAQARHEWVLSLDADERVTPELEQELRGLLAGTAPFETYAIPRRNFIGAQWIRYGGWYPSAQLKLFKKSVFRWEETTVHPRAIANVACGTLRGDLVHYSYKDRADYAAKMDRHTTLEAQKWVMDKRKVTAGKAAWRTFDRAVRSYFMKQGFRDGSLGLFVAWMAGKYQWLSYTKYRAMRRQGAQPS
jgi:glycosyltransferase involved in cell wall biosynthesis